MNRQAATAAPSAPSVIADCAAGADDAQANWRGSASSTESSVGKFKSLDFIRSGDKCAAENGAHGND